MPDTLSDDERELLMQLLEDVATIERNVLAGNPAPSEARAIFVPILRKWIAEGVFFKAQKLILPNKVMFETLPSGECVKLCKAGVYAHWLHSMDINGFGHCVGKSAPSKKYFGPNAKPIRRSETPTAASPFRAKLFFEQKVFYWAGSFYTRSDVIKMHANQLGGIHFDFDKAKRESHIMEIKNYLGFELNGQNHQLLVAGQITEARADPRRRNRVYDATEIVTIDTARTFARGVRGSDAAFKLILR